jgi:hypothetical protein
MPTPSTSRNTVLTATLASAWLCGGLSSISLLAIPALTQSRSNSTIVTQFTKMYSIGRATQPPLTLLTAGLFLYAAFKTHLAKLDGPWKLLAGAGAALLSILGFTYAVLEPTSHALMDMIHYHDIERNDEQEERDLLRKWGSLNAVRAGMAGVATAMGAWVLMS